VGEGKRRPRRRGATSLTSPRHATAQASEHCLEKGPQLRRARGTARQNIRQQDRIRFPTSAPVATALAAIKTEPSNHLLVSAWGVALQKSVTNQKPHGAAPRTSPRLQSPRVGVSLLPAREKSTFALGGAHRGGPSTQKRPPYGPTAHGARKTAPRSSRIPWPNSRRSRPTAGQRQFGAKREKLTI